MLGIAVMYFAWWSLALASLEEGTELPKAIAAGADHTVRGTTLLFGVLPLLAAHAIGLALLCLFARRWLQRPQAPWWGVLAVAVDSVIGFVLVLAITGGELLYTSH